MDDTLARMLTIANLAMRFGQIRRVTLHDDGEPESDTTHTVMLALAAMEMAPALGFDAGLAAQFAVVHDMPEIYAGDTNTAHGLTVEESLMKAQREDAALRRISSELGESNLLTMLHRYEAQQEPEARLVRYLDKVLPKLTHYLNRGTAIESMGITASGVREKHATQGRALADQYPELIEVQRLFAAACGLVEDGIDAGIVRVATISGNR